MRKHTNQIVKFAIAPCVALLLLALTLFATPEEVQRAADQTDGGMTLQPPAFLKSAHAQGSAQVDFGFLVEEAGVTAYTNLNQELDLATLESRFKTIRQQTDQFISGIMIAPDYEDLVELREGVEVQVFVHHDGWIVVYLTKWQPASVLFDWVNYDEKRLTSTLLENVVRVLVTDVGISDFTVSYYDFRHPEATNLMLVAERVALEKPGDSFEINIPRGPTVYESSWSYGRFSSSYYPGACSINDTNLSPFAPEGSKWGFATGEIAQAKSPGSTTYKLSVALNFGGGADRAMRSYCGIAIVYQEAVK